jgi:hypothetical protein
VHKAFEPYSLQFGLNGEPLLAATNVTTPVKGPGLIDVIHSASAWDASAEDYFTRSKTLCDAIEPVMPSTVMVLPSALRVVLDVLVPPGPVTDPS